MPSGRKLNEILRFKDDWDAFFFITHPVSTSVSVYFYNDLLTGSWNDPEKKAGVTTRSFDWMDGFRLEGTDSGESKPSTPKF